jgi:hypothetical protein
MSQNKKLKEIAVKSLETVKVAMKPNSTAEDLIDAYVLELSKNLIFACSDVVRDLAKNASPEVSKELKVAAVDMLDRFGL